MKEERIGKYLVVQKKEGQLDAKKPSWSVVNNSGEFLGSIEYFSRWWQYVFVVDEPGAIFSTGCMEDVTAFVKKQNVALRHKKQDGNQETIQL